MGCFPVIKSYLTSRIVFIVHKIFISAIILLKNSIYIRIWLALMPGSCNVFCDWLISKNRKCYAILRPDSTGVFLGKMQRIFSREINVHACLMANKMSREKHSLQDFALFTAKTKSRNSKKESVHPFIFLRHNFARRISPSYRIRP